MFKAEDLDAWILKRQVKSLRISPDLAFAVGHKYPRIVLFSICRRTGHIGKGIGTE
jgi:hypothetical protein